MISEELKIVIKAEAQNAINEMGKLNTTTEKTQANFTKMAKSLLGTLGLTAGLAMLSRKVVQLGKDMVAAYGNQEEAEARLAAAIRATGREADISQRRLQGLASELQKVTRYGDETTISAMAMLQQLADLNQDGLEKVTPALLDFAAAMNLDLNTAATLVGKTLGSSTNALSRYGVEIDVTAGPTEKLAQLTEVLNEKFGGTAEAMGATSLGTIARYKNAIGDLKESYGEVITEGGEKFIGFLTQVIERLTEGRERARLMKEAVENLVLTDMSAMQQVAALRDKIAQREEAIDAAKIRREDAIFAAMVAGRSLTRKELETFDDYIATQERAIRQDKEALMNAIKQSRADENRTKAQEDLNKAIREAGELVKQYRGEFLPEELTDAEKIREAITALGELRNQIRDAGGDYSNLQATINELDGKLKELEVYTHGSGDAVLATSSVFGDFNVVLEGNILYLEQHVGWLQAALIANANMQGVAEEETEAVEDLTEAYEKLTEQWRKDLMTTQERVAAQITTLTGAWEAGIMPVELYMKALNHLLSQFEWTKPKIDDTKDALREIYDTMLDRAGQDGLRTLVSTFELLGEATTGAVTAQEIFEQSINRISSMMSELFLWGAMSAFKLGELWIGLGFLALAGVSAFVSGISGSAESARSSLPSVATGGNRNRGSVHGFGENIQTAQVVNNWNVSGSVWQTDELQGLAANASAGASSGR